MKSLREVCDLNGKYLVILNIIRKVNEMTNKQLKEKRKEIIKDILEHNKKYSFPTKKKGKK